MPRSHSPHPTKRQILKCLYCGVEMLAARSINVRRVCCNYECQHKDAEALRRHSEKMRKARKRKSMEVVLTQIVSQN